MVVQLAPNVEAIVSAFLRAQPEVTAIVGTRVYTALPANVAWPAIRVNQYDEVKVTQRPLWVSRHSIQIEAWGITKDEAFFALSTAVACMSERMLGAQSGGVISNVDFGGMRDVPDPDFSPAKPRWLASAYITAHP